MAAKEVVTLDEATPQLVVPQAGDTYELPRDTNITGNLTVTGTMPAPPAHNQAWSTITSTPTTFAGYGITSSVVIQMACGAFETDSTVDAAVGRTTAHIAFTLTSVVVDVAVAPVGAIYIVDINKNGTTVLSTKLSIDASETSSRTAATPAVISVSSFALGDIITVDIDQIGVATAGQEPIVTLIGT